jgi:spermidine synthase
VDVNPAAFTFARQYLDLPDNVTCMVADGYAFLLSDSRRYDAVVLDAYQGDHIPNHLQSLDFFELVRSHLRKNGAVFANVHAIHDYDSTIHTIARRMASLWPKVRLLDSPGWLNRNVIVAAGHVSELVKPNLVYVPDVDAQDIRGELATMDFRDWPTIGLARSTDR